MPYEISIIQLPGGARCSRVEWTGVATGQEATTMLEQYHPGGRLHGMSILNVCLKMERMEPEARAAFGGQPGTTATVWVAIVVNSPIIRVATNFIMRMNRNPRVRTFGTEEEATRWLDERTRENAAKAKSAP